MRLNIVVLLTVLLGNVLGCVGLSMAKQSQELPHFYNYASSKDGILGVNSAVSPTLSHMPFMGSYKGSKTMGMIGIVSTPDEVLALARTVKNHRNKSYMGKKNASLPSTSMPYAPVSQEDLVSTPKNKSSNSNFVANNKMPSLPSESLRTQNLSSAPPIAKNIAAKNIAKVWRLTPGPLRPQLMEWSTQAGYQLVWKASNDFSMETASNFHGKFLQAMEKLFAGLQQSGGHALRVTVYEANKVITISEN